MRPLSSWGTPNKNVKAKNPKVCSILAYQTFRRVWSDRDRLISTHIETKGFVGFLSLYWDFGDDGDPRGTFAPRVHPLTARRAADPLKETPYFRESVGSSQLDPSSQYSSVWKNLLT